MPALSSPTTWRTHPHRVAGYLCVYTPPVIFACSVDQASFIYPIASITYDAVTTGAYTDINIGMTVKVYNSGGTFKGWGRIRLDATVDTLYIGALSSGDITFADDDLIEVLDDYRIWTKIPRIDASDPLNATFYKDYDLSYVAQGSQPPPVANVGPHIAGFVDDDGFLFVSFLGESNSYAMAEGISIASYANDIGDGTYITGDAAAGDFDAKFPAGERWVALTVEDDNGQTHTAYRFVKACERTGSNAPMPAQLAELRLLEEGPTASFRILASDASEDVVPEGTLVLYFEEETYGMDGDRMSGSLNCWDYGNLNYTTAAAVKFVGWTLDNSEHIEPLLDDLILRAAGPTGIMATLPMFNQTVSNTGSPSTWYQMANLTLWRLLWYMLQWHTTVFDVCDVVRPDWYASYAYHRFDVPESTIFEGINRLALYINANLMSDRNGNILFPRHPMYMTDSDRNGVATTVTLSDSDWSAIDVSQRDRESTYWIRGSGLLASSTTVTPYLSIAPGVSPGQGEAESTLNEQLVTGQTDLNVRTGRQYGIVNTKWQRISVDNLNAGLIGDPAWREWIVFTLSTDHSKRQQNFRGATRFVLTEVAYTYDVELGASSEEYVLEVETFGAPGTTLPIPIDRVDDLGYVGLPPYFPLEDYDPRPDPDIDFADAPAVYIAHHAYITRTRNHTDGAPNYEIVLERSDFDDITGFSGSIYNFLLDPWNPKMAAYVKLDNGSGGNVAIVYVENLDGPVGSQILSLVYTENIGGAVDPDGHGMLQAGINVKGSLWWVVVKQGFNGTAKLRAILSSGGSVYSSNLTCSNDYVGIFGGYHQAGGGVGRVYHTSGGYGSGQGPRIFAVDDMGQSWDIGDLLLNMDTLTGIPYSARMYCFFVPYDDNADDMLWYAGCNSNSQYGFIRRDGVGVYTPITPQKSGSYYIPLAGRYNIHCYTGNRLDTCFVGGYAGNNVLFTSEDGGDTFVDRNAPGGSSVYMRGLWGWSTNRDVMISHLYGGGGAGPYWTSDLFSAAQYGITWTSMLGDWETVTGDSWSSPHDIVPVWVK